MRRGETLIIWHGDSITAAARDDYQSFGKQHQTWTVSRYTRANIRSSIDDIKHNDRFGQKRHTFQCMHGCMHFFEFQAYITKELGYSETVS